MSNTRTDWIGWSAAVAVSVLFAAANLLKVESLWGFNLATYLPPVWLYVGLCLIAASFLPQTTNLLISLGAQLSKFIDKSASNRWLAGILAAAAFGIMCWFGSAGLPLLGDGSLRCREITDGKLWQPTEALDFLSHAIIFKLVTKPLHLEITQAFRFVSTFGGIIFLIGTCTLTRYLARERWLIWTLAGLGLGITVQFFGYVESYSIVAALIPWLILFGIRVADGNLAPKWFALFVLCGAAFHSVILLLFGASAVIGLAVGPRECERQIQPRLGAFLGAGGALAIVLIIGKELNLPVVSTYVLPLLPSTAEKVALLSIAQLLNVTNWILLSGLVVFPLFVSLGFNQGRVEYGRRRMFALSLVIPAFIFVLLFPAKLGGPIDWDLFSLPFAVIAFALLTMIEPREARPFPRWIVPILVVALINAGSFVAVNHSITASAERFNRIIPLSSSPNPWIHWSSLVIHAEHQPELFNRRNEFLIKSWQAPPSNKRDSVKTLVKLLHEAVVANDSTSSRTILLILNSITDLPPEVMASESEVFIRFGTPEEQRAYAELMRDTFPSSAIALGAAGLVFLKIGDVENCGELLRRSFELDSSNSQVSLNYGVFLANHQQPELARDVLKQSLRSDISSFVAAYYLANVCLSLGDIAGAKEAMLRAEANALRPEERERIKQLKLRL